jgi:hypothetical protein
MIVDLEHIQASVDLASGDPGRAIRILRSHETLSAELADSIAEALEKAKLYKGKGGRPPAMTLYAAVREVDMKRNVMALAVEQGYTDKKGAADWYSCR